MSARSDLARAMTQGLGVMSDAEEARLLDAFAEEVRADQREKDARRAEKISHDRAPGFGQVIAAMIRGDADRLEAVDIDSVLKATEPEHPGFSPRTLAELRASAAQAALALEEYRSDREVAFGALRLIELDALVEQAKRYAAEYAALLAWAEAQG